MNEIDREQIKNTAVVIVDAFKKMCELVGRAATTFVDLFKSALSRKKKIENTRKGWIRRTIIKLKYFIVVRKPFNRARSNTVTVKEKAEALGLLEVDTNPLVIAELYQIYQVTSDERCRDFKYYKPNRDSFMCYSEKYLNETPIEQLISKMEAVIQMGR